MNQFGKRLLSSLFIIFLFSFCIYLFFSSDYEISNIENRELAQRPHFSVDAVADGTFMKDVESYITDQFPGRNRWLKAYIDYQRITNQTYIFDYYVTNDNWVLAKPEYDFPKKELDEAATHVNEFGKYLNQQGISLYYFSVPHKVTVMQFLLPKYIKRGNYMEKINYFMNKLDPQNVTSVNMTEQFIDLFSNSEIKSMYFKTDHHWNMYGSFQGFQQVERTLNKTSRFNIEQTTQKDYETICMDHSKMFDGSYNKQLYYTVDASDESMCFLVDKDDTIVNYHVTLGNKVVEPFDVYARAYGNATKHLVNYNDLFIHNRREINIINDKKKKENNKILIIKDSYANSIAFLIAQHYYQTTIYDPRYNQDRTIYDFMEENDFDEVAIIYNSAHLTGPNYNFASFPK